MTLLITWGYIIGALLVALLGNSLGAVWASKPHWLNPWLLGPIIVGPFVFITFGLVASRVGLAIGSGTLDSLLTISTVLVGLVVFQEWGKLGPVQYAGLACVILGIILMQFEPKAAV